MEYYWELILRDGTMYDIPPSAVETVRKKMADKATISLRSASIPFSDIARFRQTDRPATDAKLLEEAARAFHEPIETVVEYGGRDYPAVKARWVKRNVTQRQWDTFYRSGNYRRLADEYDGMVTIAYVLPVHNINLTKVQECSDKEVRQLNNSF